jgi:hypothetical protein
MTPVPVGITTFWQILETKGAVDVQIVHSGRRSKIPA